MYNPDSEAAGEHPDYYNEMVVLGKGRVVKVRFADQPPPNVTWVWIPTGNCHACEYYQPPSGDEPPKCLNESIPNIDFLTKYLFENTCPGYEAGMRRSNRVDTLDVMKAVGLVSGQPSQAVEVIHDMPWSITNSEKAHREQTVFLDMARLADYVKRGGKNDPNTGEYVDLSDDLEGPTPEWDCFKPGGALEGANTPE